MCHGRFSLMDCLDEIEDPRAASNGTLYDFREMLVIAICASLCDMDTCEDFAVWAQAREPWLRKFLTLKNGTPSSATFYRLFRTLDPKQFETFFRRWVGQIIPAAAAPGQMAIDGKTIRGSAAMGLVRKSAHASHTKTVTSAQAEKDDPQPQVDVAFGLRITNCEPSRPSE